MKFLILSLFILLVSCSSQELDRSPSASNTIPELTYWPYDLEGCNGIRDQFLKLSSTRKTEFSQKYGGDCHVTKGQWKDYFTGEKIYKPEDVIVTTALPLKFLSNKFKRLNSSERQRLLGFVKDKDFLIALKKGGEGEKLYLENEESLQTLPKHIKKGKELTGKESPYLCEVVGMWIDSSRRYSLPLSGKDKRFLVSKKQYCLQDGMYNRKHYRHWYRPKTGNYKCKTREEVLKRQTQVPVTHKNPDKGECSSIATGKWYGPYTDTTYEAATRLDIDHFVPLKNSYYSGGWKWPQWKKELYANYMVDPNHLIAVQNSANRSKGAKGPEGWMPPHSGYHCEYMKVWISIKLKWDMSFTPDEAQYLQENLGKCIEDPAIQQKYDFLIDLLSRLE